MNENALRRILKVGYHVTVAANSSFEYTTIHSVLQWKSKYVLFLNEEDQNISSKALNTCQTLANDLQVDLLELNPSSRTNRNKLLITAHAIPFELGDRLSWNLRGKIASSRLVQAIWDNLSEACVLNEVSLLFQFFYYMQSYQSQPVGFFNKKADPIGDSPRDLFRQQILMDNATWSIIKKDSQSNPQLATLAQNYSTWSHSLLQIRIKQLLELEKIDILNCWQLITTVYGEATVIEELWKGYRSKERYMSDLFLELKSDRVCSPRVRTIAIFYPSYKQGGVEKVIMLQMQFFVRMGYIVVFITEKLESGQEYPMEKDVRRIVLPSSVQDGRFRSFSNIMRTYEIDVVLYHAYMHTHLFFDLLLLKTLHIPVIIGRHGVVQQDIIIKSTKAHIYPYIYRLADLVLVLTKFEETYLQTFGVEALLLPNPIEYRAVSKVQLRKSKVVLWAGRLDYQKGYMKALEIMRRVVARYPHAQMMMLGRACDKNSEQNVVRFIKDNNLTNNIQYYGPVLNMEQWYRKATVHLVTSAYESFCMVIAESKAFGIPLVTFSLPYLELLRDGKGFIEVEQNNIDDAVNAIGKLLSNKQMWEQMSEDALQSIKRFQHFNMQGAWESIFDGLRCGNPICVHHTTETNFTKRQVHELVESLLVHHQRSFNPAIANYLPSKHIPSSSTTYPMKTLTSTCGGIHILWIAGLFVLIRAVLLVARQLSK